MNNLTLRHRLMMLEAMGISFGGGPALRPTDVLRVAQELEQAPTRIRTEADREALDKAEEKRPAEAREKGAEMNELDTKMPSNEADAATIRDYFKALLSKLFEDGEGFSGKRPFGNGGWEYEVYSALIRAGIIEGKIDMDGCVDEVDTRAADKKIQELIALL